MTVDDIATALDAPVTGGTAGAQTPVLGGYVSDLLSDVMANAQDGDVWITLQRHVNVIAVARLKNLAAIVLTRGRQPEADTLARAAEHRIPIIVSHASTFDVAGRLHALGLRGRGAS